MRERETIKTMGAALSDGESSRGVCPFCGGGDSHESSFRVLRVGPAVLHYKCFRAKCGRWGYEGSTNFAPAKDPGKRGRYKIYDRELTRLPYLVYAAAPISSSGKRLGDFLSFGECMEQGFAYCPEDARIIIPIMDSRGLHLGYIARAVGGTGRVRTLTYRETERDLFHFPIQKHLEHHNGVVYCTEDIISAIAVSRKVAAFSALGTRFTQEMAAELFRIRVTKVEFFFDGDEAGYQYATKCATRARSYGLDAGIIPTPLGVDPKDLDDKTLEMLLYG